MCERERELERERESEKGIENKLDDNFIHLLLFFIADEFAHVFLQFAISEHFSLLLSFYFLLNLVFTKGSFSPT